MKKLLALLLCGTLCLSSLTGCGAKEETAETPAQETEEEDKETEESSGETEEPGDGTIEYNGKNKMAMFGPLTGDNLQYGMKIKNGAELALNQFNEEHGTEFTIEFMDDKGDPNEAVNLANKIVSDDEVFCALAGYGSSCAMATAPVFDEAGMLLMGVAASHADLPGMGEYIFPVPMSARWESVGFAEIMRDCFGAGKLAILYQNTDHGVQTCEFIKEAWESYGGEIVVYESFVPGDTKDFSAVLSKIKTAEPDIFYASAAYSDAAQIFMQAKQLELDAQYVGPGMCLNEEFTKLIGDSIDGTYILSSTPCFLPSVLESGNVDEATQKFIADYEAAYGETPDGFSAQGYDSVKIVLDSALKAGTTDTPAIAEQILAIRSYPGLSGLNMAYNENKEMNKGIYTFEIKDGNFVPVNQ